MFGRKKDETEATVDAQSATQTTTLTSIIESLLFYFAKELSLKELSTMSGHSVSDVKQALVELQATYASRGINIARTDKGALLVTSRSTAGIIQSLVEDEEKKPLSKSALETLSIVAYHGPLSRPEIDYIRGVNSTYSLRNLLVRGLIDKTRDGNMITYTPSMETFRYMGVTSKEELPNFQTIQHKIQSVLDKQIQEEKEVLEASAPEVAANEAPESNDT